MSDQLVRYIVVDNHPTVLLALEHLATQHPESLECVGAVAHPRDINLSEPPPDVVVLDLYVGRDDEASTPWVPALVEWGAHVLMHTSSEVPVPLRQAVAAGASGVALKNDYDTDLPGSIRDVAQGEFVCSSALAHALVTDKSLVAQLTAREIETARGLAAGLTVQQIAKQQEVAYETTRGVIKSVRQKYLDLGRDITNSHSIVREAVRDGWIDRQDQ